MLGALVSYITFNEHKKFQPINSNWGIVDEIEVEKNKIKDKKYKNELRYKRAAEEIERIKNEISD